MRLRLAENEAINVGRGATRTLENQASSHAILRVPDVRMSSGHARFLVENAQCYVEDLQSKNGTYVNGARIQGRAPLTGAETVRLGETLFIVAPAMPCSSSSARAQEFSASDSAFATLVPELEAMFDSLARIAKADLSILIAGETGTGKEVVARGIHTVSARSGPFVAVNCGAIPASLLESQLFGHRRGAFSGATSDEPGLFRAADGGTLLLDEIADLSPTAQAALLRVLQEREVLPVGATRPVPVDVRVVAATHKNLERMVGKGTFRADLLARLAGYVVRLPPLRDRRVDIGGLVARMLHARPVRGAANVTFTHEAGETLFDHRWPHNLRELATALARALALSDGAITPPQLALATKAADVDERDRRVSDALDELSAAKRSHLVVALERHRGNVTALAAERKTSRSQIHRLLTRLGINSEDYRK